MGGRSRRHHATATRCSAWLADVLAHRRRPHRRDPAAPRASRRARSGRAGARSRELALAATPSPGAARRSAGPGPGLPAGGGAVAGLRRELPGRIAPYAVAVGAAGRASTASPRTTPPRALSAGLRRQPDFGRGAAGAARPDRRAARAGGAGADDPRDGAARPRDATLDDLGGCASAPTSPPCGTKPNTRGCSAHDTSPQWPAARRHRRPGRHRQDRADGRAVQARSATRTTSPRSPTTSTPRKTPSS